MRAFRVFVPVLVGALLAFAPVAQADSTTATVTGQVMGYRMGPEPLVGAQVSTQDPSTGAWLTATADSNGDFTLSGLAPGDYTIYYADGSSWQSGSDGPITLSAGDDLNLGQLTTLPTTGNLTGRLTDASGAPLPGMQVQLSVDGVTSSDAPPAYTDRQGDFTMSNIPSGTYAVTVLDGALTDNQQPVELGSATVNPGATATDNLQMPPPQVNSGTVAHNAVRDLAWLNAERVANGLPGGIVLNPRWSTACAAHDAYERANGGTLTHHETSSRAFTALGFWAGTTSVLAEGAVWGPGANPFETAPFHLIQLDSPSLSVVGIDDSLPGNSVCVTTWAGMQASFAADTVSTYPGNGVSGVPPSENAAELPYVPGQFVGIPERTTAGRELFVYLNQAGVMGQAPVRLTAAALSGPQGPVAIKTIDSSTPTVGSGEPGAIIIPVKPLAPLSTYTASVTLADGPGTISHTWSFRTAASGGGSPARPAGCTVPSLLHMTLTSALGTLRRAHCRVGSVRGGAKLPPRHRVLRVTGQDPAAGSRRPAGAKVNLNLA